MGDEIKSPEWLSRMVTEQMFRMHYGASPKPNRPYWDVAAGRGDCWGCVWTYEFWTNVILPMDAFEAEREFVPVSDGKYRWRDLVVYRRADIAMDVHFGVMEDPTTILHCSKVIDGVSRESILYPPWDRARVFRHVTLR